jgi:hypothetical protein
MIQQFKMMSIEAYVELINQWLRWASREPPGREDRIRHEADRVLHRARPQGRGRNSTCPRCLGLSKLRGKL